MPQMTDEQINQIILDNFTGPHREWRTAGGIARESGASETEIAEFIQAHPERFKIMCVAGIPVYRLKDSFKPIGAGNK